MLDAILDPSIIFISSEDWLVDEKRDSFLSYFFENLHVVKKFDIAQIIWCDELESLLWIAPQTPPWRMDRDWNIPLVPIIHSLLNRCRKWITLPDGLNACKVKPKLYFEDIQHFEIFLRIMHTYIMNDEETIVCLGLPNVQVKRPKFYCSCCSSPLYPDVITKSMDWLKYVEIEKRYWPNSEIESGKLREALDIIRISKFGNTKFNYSFDFSQNFLKKIVETMDNRMNILTQMAKRLIYSSQQAAKDISLHDEYIEEVKEFRFRVTHRPKSTRIHYVYDGDNHIRFCSYFDVGKHDKGLKKR